MTTDCARVEGMMAASMYESLTASERETLDEHLDECVVCRETLRGFESLVSQIPAEQPAIEADLLPGIRSRLGAEKPGGMLRFRRRVVALAAAASIAVAGIVGTYTMSVGSTETGTQIAQSPSRLDKTFEQVAQLMDARFHSRAFVMLEQAANRFPQDRRSGEAMQMAADLAFVELAWYPEAHKTLKALRDRYSSQFERLTDNRIRLEMLEESVAASGDYLALKMLDDARNAGDFDGYEKVLSQYPGTYLADHALEEMTLALADEGDYVKALETLAETCTHPVAVAQVKLKLARTLDESGASPERIRPLYEQAATSESVALAQAARAALQDLDSGR